MVGGNRCNKPSLKTAKMQELSHIWVRLFLRLVGSSLCKRMESGLYKKGEGVPLFLQQMMDIFLDYCTSKQLRPKTMKAYEQSLRLFIRWVAERYGVDTVAALKEVHIRAYIVELQKRVQYTLSRILGHSSVTVTERAYLDVTDADSRLCTSRTST